MCFYADLWHLNGSVADNDQINVNMAAHISLSDSDI